MMTSCLLCVKVHALWVLRSELFYPVAFPSSQAFVKASKDFKDCNPEIIQRTLPTSMNHPLLHQGYAPPTS